MDQNEKRITELEQRVAELTEILRQAGVILELQKKLANMTVERLAIHSKAIKTLIGSQKTQNEILEKLLN